MSKPRRRPKLSPLVLVGLDTVRELAGADVAADPERWPAAHPVHDALAYLQDLLRYEGRAP